MEELQQQQRRSVGRARMERLPYKRKPPEDDQQCQAKKRLNFGASIAHFLLPNGTSVKMELSKEKWEDFDELFTELERRADSGGSSSSTRAVDWRSSVIEDEFGNVLSDFDQLFNGKSIFLIQDGGEHTIHKDQELWNVTPEPEMLERLPDGYNLETALADHVDNALQAVWENKSGHRRLVSVEIEPDSIVIFDTGHGMDASENSIARWGTVGASTHRDVHHKGIGGEAPYLKPYLGKYGVGGVAAALHLGRHVEVRSKTTRSQKVVSLILLKGEINQDKDRGSGIWRTHGGFHEMTEDEASKSPHGSFTSVKISGLNPEACIKNEQHYWKLGRVRRMLKDIYSLYIQCDSDSIGRTVTSVEFEVNGVNLLGESGGDVTSCNKHSCPGDPFVVHLEFQSGSELAHGRLTCQYFANSKGKETLESVIDELNEQKIFSSDKTFESYPRIGARWLGRLLPSAQWQTMPFMESKLRGRDQLHWVKRVKIFADLDAGFQPTPTKTNLVDSHHFTVALKQLGSNTKTEPEVQVNIQRGCKQVSAAELSIQFKEWLKSMHELYDEDVEFSGEPIYVINSDDRYNKILGVEKNILTFHKHLKGPSGDWRAGDRIELQKAVATKNNFYGTIEWIFCDGTAEEHGEVKMVCRPIHVLTDEGDEASIIRTSNGVCSFDLNNCKCFTVWWLTSEKCRRLNDEDWNKKLTVVQDKLPSFIEILTADDRKHFGEPELPDPSIVLEAGYQMPGCLLAVVRPRRGSGPSFKQKMIVAAQEMKLKLEIFVQETQLSDEVLLSTETSSSSTRLGIKGLFSFTVGALTKAGRYNLRISPVDDHQPELKPDTWELNIKPLATEKWILCGPESVRMDQIVETPFMVETHDKYENRISFDKPFPLCLHIEAPPGDPVRSVILKRDNIKVAPDKKALSLHSFYFPGFKQHSDQEALVFLASKDQKLGHMRCAVIPGKLALCTLIQCSKEFTACPYMIDQHLKPGDVIQQMIFKAEDKYGNLACNEKVTVKVHGLEPVEPHRKVDETGSLQLNDLRVANQFNASGSVSLFSEDTIKVAEVKFTLATRRLVFAPEPPAKATIGRSVERLVVHVVDEDGELDDSITGTLSASWENSVCFKLQQGVCKIPAIKMPQEPGLWSGKIWHSTCAKIEISFQINVEYAKACNIKKISDSLLHARCNESFDFSFRAVDNLGLPALLDDEAADEMDVQVHPDETNLLNSTDTYLVSAHIVPGNSIYTMSVVLNGKLGRHQVSLVFSTLGLKETWKVSLASGPISRLVPVILPASTDASSDPELLLDKARRQGPGEPSIRRREAFPTLLVHILDSGDNSCDQYDGGELALIIPSEPRFKQQFQAPVKDGCAHFLPFALDLQAGSYEMKMILSSPCGGGALASTSLRFQVEPGSFPSALRMLVTPPGEVIISDEEKQCLPEMIVAVEAEDGKPLRHCPQARLSILRPSGEAWVENYMGERSRGSEFIFRQVLVPTQAGNFVLKFFVPEHCDVPPISLELEVIHGAPASLQFSEEGDSRNSLLVDVLDRNGNRCLNLNGVEVCARIEAPVSNFTGQILRSPVRSGRAVFERFELDPAIYTLKVSLVDDQMNVPEVSASISAVHGEHPEDMVMVLQMLEQQSQEYHGLMQMARSLQQQLVLLKPRKEVLDRDLKLSQEKLDATKIKQLQFEKQEMIENDKEILVMEKRQPQLTEAQVFNMFSPEKDAAALAVHLALKELPPGFPADEILGLAFTFARVETKQLNDVLSNHLGARKLLTIVCKSKNASSWLEPLDPTGSIDKSRGLYAFAESKNLRITGAIPVIFLENFTGFKPEDGGEADDDHHPQKLLRIPMPLLQSGNIPPGFLGFAVNMLHLKPQHLQLQLRQTLFFYLFGKLQVYDSRKNMLDAGAQLMPSSQDEFVAVSLDGASCSGWIQMNLGKIREPRLRFTSVPYAEREKAALALPAAAAFWRKAEMEKLRLECVELERVIEQYRQEQQGIEAAIEGSAERLKMIQEHYLHGQLIAGSGEDPPVPLQSRPAPGTLQIKLFNAPRN